MKQILIILICAFAIVTFCRGQSAHPDAATVRLVQAAGVAPQVAQEAARQTAEAAKEMELPQNRTVIVTNTVDLSGISSDVENLGAQLSELRLAVKSIVQTSTNVVSGQVAPPDVETMLGHIFTPEVLKIIGSIFIIARIIRKYVTAKIPAHDVGIFLRGLAHIALDPVTPPAPIPQQPQPATPPQPNTTL